jgi:hypothetical protein
MAANILRDTRIAGLAAIFVAAAVLQFVPTARTDPTTLPKLFPALTDLPESKALVISMTWLGLSPLSPVRADYMLNLHNDQFEGVAHFKVAEAKSAKRSIAVPHDLIRTFLAATSKVEVVEKPYQPRITHTDDYPSISIGVPVQDGQLIVGTNSQEQQSGSEAYADRTPWAITFAGRTFVVTASDLDKAFDPLLPALQYDDAIKELEKQGGK